MLPPSPRPAGEPPSAMLASVKELQHLSSALSNFSHRWSDLQFHVDSINSSIESLSNKLDSSLAATAEAAKTAVSGSTHRTFVEEKHRPSNTAEKAESSSELDSICAGCNGKDLRRYIVTHMTNLERLREEVSEALRRAPDPENTVLSCFGGFYIQGKKAFEDPSSQMVSTRRAAILALEFYLQSGRAQPQKKVHRAVRSEAVNAALSWRKRLIAEGGLESSGAVDALGLVLLIASFGIPSEFKNEEIYTLLQLCNLKKKATVLRLSPILLQKVPVIIQDLVQNGKHLTAVDLSIGFELQEKFPPLLLLKSFLDIMCNEGKEEKKEDETSFRSLKEAAEKQVDTLKSVAKILEDHKLDSDEFSNLKINAKIAGLERRIIYFDKRLDNKNLKRRAEEFELMKTRSKIPSTGNSVSNARASPLGRTPEQYNITIPDPPSAYNQSPPRIPYEAGCYGLVHHGAIAAAESWWPSRNEMDFYRGTELYTRNGIGSLANGITTFRRWHEERALVDDNSGELSGMGNSPLTGRNFMEASAEMLPSSAAGQNLIPSGLGNRSSPSSLYHFADTVLESESRRSFSSNAPPATSYHSPYLP